MQREYVILSKPDNAPVMTSINNSDYCDYIQSGWTEVMRDNKKACMAFLEMELETV